MGCSGGKVGGASEPWCGRIGSVAEVVEGTGLLEVRRIVDVSIHIFGLVSIQKLNGWGKRVLLGGLLT